jgi:hypothetical protein
VIAAVVLTLIAVYAVRMAGLALDIRRAERSEAELASEVRSLPAVRPRVAARSGKIDSGDQRPSLTGRSTLTGHARRGKIGRGSDLRG